MDYYSPLSQRQTASEPTYQPPPTVDYRVRARAIHIFTTSSSSSSPLYKYGPPVLFVLPPLSPRSRAIHIHQQQQQPNSPSSSDRSITCSTSSLKLLGRRPWATGAALLVSLSLPLFFLSLLLRVFFSAAGVCWRTIEWNACRGARRAAGGVREDVRGEAQGEAPGHHCVAPWPRRQWRKVTHHHFSRVLCLDLEMMTSFFHSLIIILHTTKNMQTCTTTTRSQFLIFKCPSSTQILSQLLLYSLLFYILIYDLNSPKVIYMYIIKVKRREWFRKIGGSFTSYSCKCLVWMQQTEMDGRI